MEPVAATVAKVLDATEPVEMCSACRTERAALDATLCPRCDQRARYSSAVRLRIDEVTAKALARAGVGRREMTATLDAIPEAVLAALRSAPKTTQPFERGFGLSGGAGVGKSCALVAMLRGAVRGRILARVEAEGQGALAQFAYWVTWPEWANRMRVASVRDGGLDVVDGWIHAWAGAEVLVLDDLGGERAKDYNADWVGSLLDLLVDARHRDMRPTWYTTNLSAREFAGRYGARMFSRLCGENPVLEIRPGPDLRLKP